MGKEIEVTPGPFPQNIAGKRRFLEAVKIYEIA
jgi:hypothetical protein